MKGFHLILAGVVIGATVPAARAWDTNDWQFIETIQRVNLRFFQEQKRGPYNLLNDTAPYDADGLAFPPYASVAGTGFELTAICLGHYRGWIPYADAYEQVLEQLRAFDGQLSDDPDVFHREDGWTHHTYWIDGADAGKPFPGIDELSILDHSMLVAGCIFVSEYFKGTEAAEIAHRLYEQTQWNSRPNIDYNFGYSENLLAIIESAEAPAHKKGGDAFTIWQTYIIPPFPRTLQFYFWQYPHAWIDFRFRTDQQGNNHADIARDSILHQRQRAIDLNAGDPDTYDMLGSNVWGWTAATSSGNEEFPVPHYRQMAPWPLFLDGELDDEHASDSGTITPFGLPGCMVYAGTETMAAMKYIFEEFYINGWDADTGELPVWSPVYGWINAINKGKPYRHHFDPAVSNWFWAVNAGIDYGPNVLLLENHKLGTTWRFFMQNPYISAGMTTIGFGPTQRLSVATFAGGTNEFGCGIGSWHNDDTPVTIEYVDADATDVWLGDQMVRIQADNSDEGGWIDICDPLARDQRAQAEISFWIKGHTGLEVIEVGLRDALGNENKTPLAGHTGGETPTNWTRVKIPLEIFCLTGDVVIDTWPGDLNGVTFAFLNPEGGGLDIDGVAFTRDTLAPARPDEGFGAAQIGRRPAVTWHPDALERDVVGLRVWRREDGDSGFEEVTHWIEPLHRHPYVDNGTDGHRAREARYAVQAFDNAQPQHSSPFALEQILELDPAGRLDLDWNNGMNPNTLGGNADGWFPAELTNVFDFVYTNHPGGGPGWIRRSVVPQAGGGHYIFLNDADLGDYAMLRLWVRAADGNPEIELGLKDSSFEETRRNLTGYLPGGSLSTNWSRITVPFSDFPNVDFSSMDNLSLTYLSPGESHLAGIAFLPGQRVRLDGFREAEHWAEQDGSGGADLKPSASGGEVLGNGWGSGDDHYASYHIHLNRAHTNPVLSVRYAKAIGSGTELQVEWNGAGAGGLTVTNTGGWGESPGEFAWAALVLPTSTAGTHTLVLRTTQTNEPVNLDGFRITAAGSHFRECEAFDHQSGSGGGDVKPGASGGAMLGNSWGDPAGSVAVYSNIAVGALDGAWLHLWYAHDNPAGAIVDAHVNEIHVARLVCPGTGGWGDRAYQIDQVSVPLGAFPAGNHTVRFSVPDGGYPINLDAFHIGPEPPDSAASNHDGDALSDRQEAVLGADPFSTDTDGDGLSDSDELIGGMTGVSITDPLNPDTDGDGFGDLEERIAGTDGLDDQSFFRIRDVTVMPEQMIRLQWDAAPGRAYDVLRRAGPLGDSADFLPVADPENILTTNGAAQYDAAATNVVHFFRIRVEHPAP